MTQTIVGASVLLIAIYLFVINADGADRVIRALGSSYGEAVRNLQGR